MADNQTFPQTTNATNPVGSSPADAASIQRVHELRKSNPGKTADALVDLLIRNRCMQVAGVGAATAGAAAIPTVGALASVAVGSMVDMDSTQRVLHELILDIATIYDYPFEPGEKEVYMQAALGLNSGHSNAGTTPSAAEQLLVKGGQQLAQRATQRIAQKSVGRAIPVIGVATSAGSNILMTYSAAQRAKIYIQSGPDSVGDLETTLRSSLGMEELRLSDWTFESLSSSMSNLSDAAIEGFDQGAQKAGRAAGKATRKLAKFLRKATTPRQ